MAQNWELEINTLLNAMTLDEKIGMIHGAGLFRTEGIPRLFIPPLKMSDGPMGVRAEFKNDAWVNTGTTEDYVSYLPSNSAIAATWNRKLAGEAGKVLGEEARGRGKDVILAPGINIKRSPLCGRNFEYMSEDPKLIEELCVPLIQGIQKSDVAACVKHFAANSQETQRLMVDEIIDERTLNEIYFPGFYAAVTKGKSYSIMGAYNKLNGEHCSTSQKLLNDTLRKKWGYDGAVISDWGAVHDTTLAAESALDLEMDVTYDFSKHYMADGLKKKIQQGELKEELVDEKVRNLLRLMFRLKMIGDKKDRRKPGSYNTRAHQESIQKVAEESMILLKNEKNILPLDPHNVKRIAVIGQNGSMIHSNGGGSAEIKALYEISPLMGIMKYLGGNAKVVYAKGYEIPQKQSKKEENWQAASTKSTAESQGEATEQSEENKAFVNSDTVAEQLLQEALQVAKTADVVLFIGGLNHDFDVEGLDRESLDLPYGQNHVISELLSVRPDTIVTILSGSTVAMPWVEKADTLLWSYYAGMETGTALARILFGEVNPSGKLPETMIRSIEQCPAHTIGEFGKTDVVEYREGIMVGYRYYDTQKMDVLFPFGHGCSYTTFTYRDLKVEENRQDRTWCVRVTVENTGEREGAQVLQLYTAYQDSPKKPRPCHELKGFEKISLGPGESEQVEFLLCEQDFSIYIEETHAFALQTGNYILEISSSSRENRLAIPLKIQ